MTDYLRSVADTLYLLEPIVPILERGLRAAGDGVIVDLASGAGGGWGKLAADLARRVPGLRVTLTDLYPNVDALAHMAAAAPDALRVDPRSIDARAVPEDLGGRRTQFVSFHHFQPDDAQRILQNAVDAGKPILIVEVLRRDVPHLIKISFSPLFVLLVTPFARPFRLGRLFWTYLVPIVPLAVMWDGLVSVLRCYTGEELRAMTERLEGGDRYVWEIGEAPGAKSVLPYLLGRPSGAKDGP